MVEFINKIPKEVRQAIESLQRAGFDAFIVGGCVRDILRGVKPSDWDIATNADPEAIQKVFADSFCDNKFGTVVVRMPQGEVSEGEKQMEIEVTPFRVESKYTDKRHPDKVEWVQNIADDLGRRDFTVNAIALGYTYKEGADSPAKIEIIDPFSGRADIEAKVIRAVRDPGERFLEDALRMMRAARFAVTLGDGWKIERSTREAVVLHASWMKVISQERIRDELLKIIMSDRAAEGIDLLHDLGLLVCVLPELEAAYGVGQNKHHLYDVYRHSVQSLAFAAKKNFSMHVRVATLLHDIGKPQVKQGEGLDSTFYNHEVVGAKIAGRMIGRLKFSKKDSERIVRLVRYHLFYYNVGEVGEASVRRLVRKVGMENVEDLLQVRMADRIGSGCPKAEPYKLRHLRYLMEKASLAPISAKMLKINGNDIMKLIGIAPGPRVGKILDVLLGYSLEDPSKNNRDFLEAEAARLGALPDSELEAIAQKAETEKEVVETKRDEMTKKKYWVT